MSIHELGPGHYQIRWREGGRNKSTRIRGPRELAKKIERKKMSTRDENRHLDVNGRSTSECPHSSTAGRFRGVLRP